MPNDKVFGSEFSFKGGDPWESESRGKRLMQRRGRQNKLPGKNRTLLGLPEDQQPDGTSLDESLNERYEKNTWDREQFASTMKDEENEDAAEDDDKDMTDGERLMWRFFSGSKPSDKRLKPQKWIDEKRMKRRTMEYRNGEDRGASTGPWRGGDRGKENA